MHNRSLLRKGVAMAAALTLALVPSAAAFAYTPYASYSVTETGSTNIVTVPFPYINQSDVQVFLGTTLLPTTSYTWTSASTIQLTAYTAGALSGQTIRLQRLTQITTPDVIFEPGPLSYSDLNTENDQLLYSMQELWDAGLTGISVLVVPPPAPTTPLPPGCAAQTVLIFAGGSADPGCGLPPAYGYCPSLMDFGADPTGATYSDAALAEAATASSVATPGYVCVIVNPGHFKLANQFSYTLANDHTSFAMYGSGPEISILDWTTNGGAQLVFTSTNNSVHVHDLSLWAGGTGTSHPALWLDDVETTTNGAENAVSDITNVTIRGNDGYDRTNYWPQGVYIESATAVNLNNVNVFGGPPDISLGGGYGDTGVGVTIVGTVTAESVIVNIVNSSFNGLHQGLYYGTYVEGVTIANSNFTADNFGIVTGVSQVNNLQLSVVNTQLNTYSAGLFEQTCISDTAINGSFFIAPYSDAAIALDMACNFEIGGSYIVGTGTTTTDAVGLVVTTTLGTYPGVVTGTEFAGFPGNPVYLGSASNHVNLQSNIYSGNGNAPLNAGTDNTIGGGSP